MATVGSLVRVRAIGVPAAGGDTRPCRRWRAGQGGSWPARIDAAFEPREVNGRPGAIFRDRDGRIPHTLVLDVLDGGSRPSAR